MIRDHAVHEGRSLVRVPAWAWTLLALPLVAGVGLWTYRAVASAMRARLEGSLQTMLASDVATLRQWLDGEANIAPSCRDRRTPNTIAIYDYGKTPDGTFYYAMEYLPGLPLDQVIQGDGPQPESRVVHLVKQVCTSLAEAHRIGLVHRDVKPANVMLCERGGTFDVVKVLDFGLVKELDSRDDSGVTAMGHVVGTPLYMAPEGASGAALVGPRSDVYAVGAVAYALVTGLQVFTGDSGVEIIGHHLHTPPVPPSERLGRPVDPFLERLILACLAKRPEKRPADAGALLQELEEGWQGAAWTQREAREWWETKAPDMLAARRAAEESVSRGPKLAVAVSSRVGSQSLPELVLEEGEKTRVRPAAPPSSKES